MDLSFLPDIPNKCKKLGCVSHSNKPKQDLVSLALEIHQKHTILQRGFQVEHWFEFLIQCFSMVSSEVWASLGLGVIQTRVFCFWLQYFLSGKGWYMCLV